MPRLSKEKRTDAIETYYVCNRSTNAVILHLYRCFNVSVYKQAMCALVKKILKTGNVEDLKKCGSKKLI